MKKNMYMRAMFEVDLEGLNPLMRAGQYGRTYLKLLMLQEYRTRTEQEHTLFNCRNKVERIQGVDALIMSRDHDGNTPLHLLIFDLAQLILQNTQGQTIFNLITSLPDIPPILDSDAISFQSKEASRGGIMGADLLEVAREREHYRLAALEKDRQTDDDDDDDDSVSSAQSSCDDDYNILGQHVNGKNILHIATEYFHKFSNNNAARRSYRSFIKVAIEDSPQLMYQKDYNGDTPLHVAARIHSGALLLPVGGLYQLLA
ncbi:Ankyrin repeat-containing protein NPR4 [Bienertia sinuspersici]